MTLAIPPRLDAVCATCTRSMSGPGAYWIGGQVRCLRCTLRDRPLLRRSVGTALVVGTILTAINQGAVIREGTLSPALLWQIPLTYLVPFCVATWGALSNSRRA